MQGTWHQEKWLNVNSGMSATTSRKSHPLQLGNVLNVTVFSTEVCFINNHRIVIQF